jgi:hypothetical protein
MLSLSPRYDLFRFAFPKDFLPKELEQKYMKILNKTPGVITSPIDYLNESIQSVTIPGISDIVITQQQHSSNDNTRGAGRINVEPRREAIYQSTSNPLEKINPEFRVTFRLNQGFYNYFMLYEAIFHQVCKTHNKKHQDILFVELLNEEGEILSESDTYFHSFYLPKADGSLGKTTSKAQGLTVISSDVGEDVDDSPLLAEDFMLIDPANTKDLIEISMKNSKGKIIDYYLYKYTVNMWVEGSDSESVSALNGGKFRLHLNFRTAQ